MLVGSLVHCALVIPDGKPQFAGLIAFMAAFPCSRNTCFLGHVPDTRTVRDTKWWPEHLSQPLEGMSIASPQPQSNICIFTDTSTSFGLGITINDEFISCHLHAGWKSHSHDIGWAEAITIKLAIHWVVLKGICDASLAIHCDNQGVVYDK